MRPALLHLDAEPHPQRMQRLEGGIIGVLSGFRVPVRPTCRIVAVVGGVLCEGRARQTDHEEEEHDDSGHRLCR